MSMLSRYRDQTPLLGKAVDYNCHYEVMARLMTGDVVIEYYDILVFFYLSCILITQSLILTFLLT